MSDLVIDTNVVFPALYDPDSVPGRIIELALEGTVTLYAPDTVQTELGRVLQGKLGYTDDERMNTREALPIGRIEAAIYEERPEAARAAIGDPEDAPVLATALVVDAPIVSGDEDFHPLEEPLAETYRPRASLEDIGDR